MEAPRDGFLFNSMLKRQSDISKLPKTLYGKQIHRVRMYVTLQYYSVLQLQPRLGAGKAN